MTDDTNQQPAISDADWIAILRNPDMRIGHLQELIRQAHAEIERAREQVIGREAVVRAILAEPRVYRPGHKTDTVYHEYLCSGCGKAANNCYMEPFRTRMLERRLCWNCNYWRDFEARLERDHASMTIIEGHVYGPGSRTSGSMRGMAGRRFDIEYIAPSVHVGKRITTFDLWSGSALPDKLKARFPDTAKFLGGATKAQAGDMTCWDPSDSRTEPYPLPDTLALK